MKIFPTLIKKIINIVSGGGGGLMISTGTETERMDFSAAMTQDTGTETELMAHTEAATLPTGVDSQSMAISLAGTSVWPQGTETESMGFTAIVALQMGTASEAFAASASADLSQFTSSATAALISGSPNWTNPSNAAGAINGTEAAISFAPVTETGTHRAQLRCIIPPIGATPSGFTRSTIKIRIRHRWDLTLTAPVAGVADARHTVYLLDQTELIILQTLVDRLASGGGGTQATLLTEEFVVTPTDPQLAAGMAVYFDPIYTFLVANGNASWQVDAAHLVTTYTRTGIV